LEDGIDLGFEDGEFVVGSAQFRLEALHHALAHLRGIEPASASPATTAAVLIISTSATTAASPTAAVVLVISAAAATAAVVNLTQDGEREHSDERHRGQPADSVYRRHNLLLSKHVVWKITFYYGLSF
jgi:hypothetical protein